MDNSPNRCCLGFRRFKDKGNSLGCSLEQMKGIIVNSHTKLLSFLGITQEIRNLFSGFSAEPLNWLLYGYAYHFSHGVVVNHFQGKGIIINSHTKLTLFLSHHCLNGLKKGKFEMEGSFGETKNLRDQLCIKQTYMGFLVITS